MRPIEKYQEKFIELLKEAEEELGPGLQIRVCSQLREIEPEYTTFSCPSHTKRYERVYRFELGTTGYYG